LVALFEMPAMDTDLKQIPTRIPHSLQNAGAGGALPALEVRRAIMATAKATLAKARALNMLLDELGPRLTPEISLPSNADCSLVYLLMTGDATIKCFANPKC
jgi:hypothetical protein